MMGRAASVVAALGCGLALAAATPALAADSPARAGDSDDEARAEGRRHFEAGEQHFQKNEYAQALVEYEAGYRITRLPGFLINIAHCHRLSGDLRKARAYYRKYLLVMPTSSRRAEVEEMIAKLDQTLSHEAKGEGGEAAAAAASKPPRTPSIRWWVWSAMAASVVGSTVATMALAASEEKH
jgi:hypothetical protein